MLTVSWSSASLFTKKHQIKIVQRGTLGVLSTTRTKHQKSNWVWEV